MALYQEVDIAVLWRKQWALPSGYCDTLCLYAFFEKELCPI